MLDLFFLKLLDGALGTIKNVFLYKNKIFLSAFFNAIGTSFYFLMVVKLVNGNPNEGIWIIALATFLGSYLPPYIMNKMEKDKVWIFDVTPDNNENGKQFADHVREKNIPVLTYKGFNGSREPVLCTKIFSQTKEHSKLIEELIPSKFKYHIMEIQNKV